MLAKHMVACHVRHIKQSRIPQYTGTGFIKLHDFCKSARSLYRELRMA